MDMEEAHKHNLLPTSAAVRGRRTTNKSQVSRIHNYPQARGWSVTIPETGTSVAAPGQTEQGEGGARCAARGRAGPLRSWVRLLLTYLSFTCTLSVNTSPSQASRVKPSLTQNARSSSIGDRRIVPI